jgi:hypothetical protein
MDKAIKKILRNFVFEDIKLPHIEIKTVDTFDKSGKIKYFISAHLTPEYDAFHSDEDAISIMNKMETALMMLGFSSVHGQRLRREGVLEIQAFGVY